MSKSKPHITANATEAIILKARRKALEAGKSLRQWAGEILANHLSPKSKSQK